MRLVSCLMFLFLFLAIGQAKEFKLDAEIMEDGGVLLRWGAPT